MSKKQQASKWVSAAESKSKKINPPEQSTLDVPDPNYKSITPITEHTPESYGFISKWIYKWNVATTLNLLDPFERYAINTIVIGTAAISAYYTYNFVKQFM